MGNNKNFESYLGKKIHIIIDRPLGTKHPKWNFIYPINYGFIPDTLAADDEEIDAYLLGVFEPISNFTGICIAIIHRINDNDDKLIIIPENKDYTNDQIMALTEFQERFFKSTILVSRKKPQFLYFTRDEVNFNRYNNEILSRLILNKKCYLNVHGTNVMQQVELLIITDFIDLFFFHSMPCEITLENKK